MKIPRLQFLGDDEDTAIEAQPLDIRRLRESGGSVVVTIPPDVVDLVEMEVGDVVHATEDSISLTKLPTQYPENSHSGSQGLKRY